jgi:MinD superfamily P-loop ATPase
VKQIVILSGKGGTGKTTLAASLSVLVPQKVMVDADVDAANLHLLLSPRVIKSGDFYSGKKAVIDKSDCVECGLCRQKCEFDAISQDYVVNPMKCEGCGVCVYVCPQKTINFQDNIAGKWFHSKTKYGEFFHAELSPAEENSGQLVTYLRRLAENRAKELQSQYLILDGSPGIGCPVISSVTGVDLAVLVTEPSLSGLSDLKRVLSVVKHFGVKAVGIINRYDLNSDVTKKVEEFLNSEKVEVIGKISFDPVFSESQLKSIPVVEYSFEYKDKFLKIWEKIEKILE